MEFNKILVANRGEIAIRIMRAANELKKKTVAVFAEEDKLSLHRFKSDEAYRIGEGLGPVSAYLSIQDIIRVAKQSGADAVHPGYGLLSENPEFAEACVREGIAFIGPTPETMRLLGDKSAARIAADSVRVPVVPATPVLPDDFGEAKKMAEQVGYPLMLKASWGGGGRGMRVIRTPGELEEKIIEGRREAEAAFGNGACFLEKLIERARHVEVQILGDKHGSVYHLYERDCTVQRRNQKVVERAPAPYLSEDQRREVCELALRLARKANYQNAGTVEFLMDIDTGKFHFIEVNPRIQVEHTVTEEVTGIDIVKAQIRVAEGADLAAATGAPRQEDVELRGHALQSRITTEDPQNNFIPDYGKLAAYRSATGIGIRLDGGTAYSGGVITRHYDSLLVKITAWAPTKDDAIARMDRALREFRIRGVSTNISFIEALLQHPVFLSEEYTTRFIDSTPELFQFQARRDRGTRILTYIADVIVNGHPEITGSKKRPAQLKQPKPPSVGGSVRQCGAKRILDEKGPQAVADWMATQNRLLVTDTTMRDGHQSLLATRMRTYDMLNAADAYSANLPELFSLECWGGATFDVAYRFLQECPWQRLRDLRARIPNILLQMLFRGSNGVGYASYPDNVVRFFVKQAADTGIDLFRVFDSLNWVENMRVAIDAILDTGKICEAAICYTGDILDPDRSKYDLKYYVQLGKQLRDAGAHILCIKDMAGLIKPHAAKVLVKNLKEDVGLPIHFHTHDTSGIAAASVLAASEAGADAADLAMDSFSGGTSQPCLGSVAEALKSTPRDTGLDIASIRELSGYWEQVRELYAPFDEGLAAPASEVYLHEMPGGQFSNLKAQARALGLEDRWQEIANAYVQANQIFGDLVKVTPTSKVIGDMALMMVSQGLTREMIEDPNVEISFPESVVELMRGDVGQPLGGFPDAIQKKVLKGSEAYAGRPGDRLPPIDLEDERRKLSEELDGCEVDDEDLNGYLMYPKVFLDYMKRHRPFGPVRTLPTSTFFYGMLPREEISVEMEPGKILEIRLQAVGEVHEKGDVRVFFELNGQPRVVRVTDRLATAELPSAVKAEPGDPHQIGAPMPGTVASLSVAEGQKVSKGTLLLTIEAMKMETGIYSEMDAVVKKIHVAPTAMIDAKDLMIELEDPTD